MSVESQALIDYLEGSALALPRQEIQRRWSRAALRAAIRSGRVSRLLPSVYAAALHARSFRTRASAVAAQYDAVIIGPAACHLLGLLEAPRVIIIAGAPGQTEPATPWLTCQRLSVPIPHVRLRDLPVRVAAPAFAVATAYGRLEPAVGADLVYRSVQRRRVRPAELESAVAALPRIPGRRRLEALVRAVAGGSESHLETRGLQRVFNTRDFRGFVRQHEVVVEGQLSRLDMYHPATRTAVELDGAGHAEPGQRERDIARDARLATAGILTVRFSWRQLTTQPEECRIRVRQILEARARGTPRNLGRAKLQEMGLRTIRAAASDPETGWLDS
ncbi:endonuclease domain-containing protein [Demequina activiva]|uniref:DUF559 domain-containing protein n=1 Tax=Demequina activiva TaxID=1582364 RepID=A0A919ULS6_9MICO|nr:DUF559 domain-containing protein [Demequina activiva]GIG55003.1 hypothetical protein Dac01nite_17550 [Demequina activiva]